MVYISKCTSAVFSSSLLHLRSRLSPPRQPYLVSKTGVLHYYPGVGVVEELFLLVADSDLDEQVQGHGC